MSKQQTSKKKDITKKTSQQQQDTKTFISKNVNSQNQPIKAPSKHSQKIKQINISAQINQKTAQKQIKNSIRQFPEPDEYNVLKMSGILDAYQHFLKLLCKHGLPTGRVYDYAAQQIQKYERRKINKELKMRAELDIQKIKKPKVEPSPQKPFHPSPSPYTER